ncbi:MAG: helix-turn-helix domain-containing protein [Chloroflexi bacterium]|nr:helix-turn-helix domain-containing protein [Chloroflexota bacterium]
MGRRPNQGRLDRYEEVVPEYPGNIRPSRVARLLGVPRSTVQRDLPALEERGTLLIEDGRGLLSLFRRKTQQRI